MAKNNYTISAVSRALKILKLFDSEHRTMSLTEISVRSGINKSSVLRVLESLETEGFIRRSYETKKYQLGIEIFKLGNSGYEFVDFKNIAYPYVKKAVDKTDLVAHIGIIDDDNILVISKVWPSNCMENISMTSFIGSIEPAYCTGVGKALTAFTDEKTRQRILAKCNYKPYTENTITTKERFLEELEITKKRGYAISSGEHEPYITCTTYPVINIRNKVLAAISLTGLTQVVESMDQNMLHETMRELVKGILSEAGYYGL